MTAAIIAVIGSMNAHAQEKKWSDQAEMSYVQTGGNTDVMNLSLKNTLKYDFVESVRATWRLGALKGEADGIKNAESYFTDLRVDKSYNEQIYSFGIAGWTRDRFAGVDDRYHMGLGGGWKFLTGPKHFFVGELGATYTSEKYLDETNKDYLGSRVFSQYEYAFTEKNRFSQSLEYLYDFDDAKNYNVNSETALIAALNGNLSLKMSCVVKYDHVPVDALKKTDTIAAVTLVVNY